jgi:hypothetical protein
MARSPYPLAGEPRDVVEDVARLGGFGVAAHGDAQDTELRWTDWRREIDALEWLNLGTVWREATAVQIARASIGYWFRPSESLAIPMARPVAILEQFDRLARTRRVIALAATDAHGPVPRSYDASFRTITTRVELDASLERNASADAARVIAALRAGRHYSVVDALGTPAAFAFAGRRHGSVVRAGDTVEGDDPITLEGRLAGPPGTVLAWLRDGAVVEETSDSALTHQADGRPAAYRLEARLPNAPGEPSVPWIVSNAIFVGISARRAHTATAPATARIDLTGSGTVAWHAEHDRDSVATITDAASNLVLRFLLGDGPPRNQFVALALPMTPEFASYDRMSFEARSSVPVRLSVQLRASGDHDPPRWRRSVYLDESPRQPTIAFAEMTPVPPNRAATPTSVGALLLVLETTNTAPGTAGEIVFSEIALERSSR